MLGKKKIQGVKSSYLHHFIEKSHENWNVNSDRVFPWLYVKKKLKKNNNTKQNKKNSIFWFQAKKVFWDLKCFKFLSVEFVSTCQVYVQI